MPQSKALHQRCCCARVARGRRPQDRPHHRASPFAITRSRVSRGRGCIVTVNRSIVRAFRDDGMRLHCGGGRVVACARRILGGQVIGTGIRHELQRHRQCMPACAVIHVASCVIEADLRGTADLELSLSGFAASPSTVAATVNLPSIVRPAEVHDPPRSQRSEPTQKPPPPRAHRDGRTHRSCPARAPSGTFARSAPTRDTKAQGTTPGPSSISPPTDRLRDAAPDIATRLTTFALRVFSGSRRSSTPELPDAPSLRRDRTSRGAASGGGCRRFVQG